MFKKNRPTSPMDLGELPADREAFDRWAAEHAKVDRRAEIKRKAGSVVGHLLAWGALYLAGMVAIVLSISVAAFVWQAAQAWPWLWVAGALVAAVWWVQIKDAKFDRDEAEKEARR